ncbi:MAG: AAA family ATPase [Spirochaetaceae bacterium]|jgi:MoxR-like ATPase|nr:AAA family ATPase [Spirochaetaceae bacterium]
MSVKEKISTLLAYVHEGMYEREEAMALTLLASLAEESVFLMGPPGVAKSMIPRRLKFAYTGAAVFEYLVHASGTPDELFGLDDKGNAKGSVFFLNDIWKAGPVIQNTLLRVLNEKSFRQGDLEIRIPIKALIVSANTLPPRNQGFGALWDRILVRLKIDNIQDRRNFDAMICASGAAVQQEIPNAITDEEYQAWSRKIDGIAIPQNVLNVLHSIRDCTKQHDIYVSDCRWRKIVRLLRTAAFLNGRDEIDLMDCFLIKHCIWNDDKQIPQVSQFVDSAIENYGVACNFAALNEELAALRAEIAAETVFIKDAKIKVLDPVCGDYYEILNPPNAYNTLIRITDYNKLTDVNYLILLGYFNSAHQRVDLVNSYHIRKGSSPFGIFIEDKEHKLKITVQEGKQQITKKPHPKVEEIWDARISAFLQDTKGIKEEIEQYRTKNLEHQRTNLFVKPELANLVESHITAMQNQILRLELDVKDIQNTYKTIKDEEVMLDPSVSASGI